MKNFFKHETNYVTYNMFGIQNLRDVTTTEILALVSLDSGKFSD